MYFNGFKENSQLRAISSMKKIIKNYYFKASVKIELVNKMFD